MDHKPTWKQPRLVPINPFGGTNNNPYELPALGAVGWTNNTITFYTTDTTALYPAIKDVDTYDPGVVNLRGGGTSVVGFYSTVAPYS